MRKQRLFLCLAVILAARTADAEIGRWRNFTSMKDVNSVASRGEEVWAATTGGLFKWDQTTNTFQLFTNAEGLQTVDLTSVAIDQSGDVWTGTATGVVHVYSPSTGKWRYVLDISAANRTNKRINNFTMYGDTALVCTDFGLSVVKIRSLEFGDTYTRFGNLPANLRLAALSTAIYDGKIWIALTDLLTNHRIAVASLSNPNLLPPEAWTLQTVGTANDTVKTLSVFNNTLYAGTSSGLYSYANGSWVLVGTTAGLNVVSLSSSSSVLVMCSMAGRVDTLGRAGIVGQFGSTFSYLPTSIAMTAAGQPIVGVREGGILVSGGPWSSRIPNGPASNQFLSVAVDVDGNVWAGSGYNGNGKGLYRYNGREWKSFITQNSPLPTNDYYRVSAGCDGSVWASSWGRGVLELVHGVESIDTSHIFSTNVGMVGIPGAPNYVVVSSVVCDRRGNHWMAITRAADSRILAVRRSDGTWATFPIKIGSSTISTLQDNVPADRSFAVDAFDNLWGVSRQSNYLGVFSLGNRGAIDDSVDYFLTTADGLPSNDVTTITVDRDNDVWVGTDKGIGIILDPASPKKSGSVASYKPLNGLVINTIAVDAINQKWVGTTEGVIVLSQDGTQVVASYTVANTGGKLIDNDVKSIAIDGKSGTVYFATLNGLASLTTAAAEPRASFDGLTIYPNPYIVPSAKDLTVEGLVANSLIKILSIDGRLIRAIVTPGGRLGFWDGKDDEGKDVGSGVYIVVAYTEDGQTATGKVAVVRR